MAPSHVTTGVGGKSIVTVPATLSSEGRATVVWRAFATVSGSMTAEEYLSSVQRLLSPTALAVGSIVGALFAVDALSGAENNTSSPSPSNENCKMIWRPAVIVPRPDGIASIGLGDGSDKMARCAVFASDTAVPVVEHVPRYGRYRPASQKEVQLLPFSRIRFRGVDRWFTDDFALEVGRWCSMHVECLYTAL